MAGVRIELFQTTTKCRMFKKISSLPASDTSTVKSTVFTLSTLLGQYVHVTKIKIQETFY